MKGGRKLIRKLWLNHKIWRVDVVEMVLAFPDSRICIRRLWMRIKGLQSISDVLGGTKGNSINPEDPGMIGVGKFKYEIRRSAD